MILINHAYDEVCLLNPDNVLYKIESLGEEYGRLDLYNKKGCMSYSFRTGRLVKELLEARERGFKSVTELVECDISVGLDEHHTLLVAIHHQASVRTVLNPSSQRVVEN